MEFLELLHANVLEHTCFGCGIIGGASERLGGSTREKASGENILALSRRHAVCPRRYLRGRMTMVFRIASSSPPAAAVTTTGGGTGPLLPGGAGLTVARRPDRDGGAPEPRSGGAAVAEGALPPAAMAEARCWAMRSR